MEKMDVLKNKEHLLIRQVFSTNPVKNVRFNSINSLL